MVFGWMTAAHKQKEFPCSLKAKQGGGVIMTLHTAGVTPLF